MLKRILLCLLSIFLILSFSLITMAHPLLLNVTYDECSKEDLVDGENELWYRIDDVFPRFLDTFLHLSDMTTEIKYLFSERQEWIDCVKQVAAGDPWYISLYDDEAANIVDEIQSVYVESMKKWNDVYYFSCDNNGNRVTNKIITVTEGTSTDYNVKIYPTSLNTDGVASTIYDYPANDSPVDYWDVLACNHAHILMYKMTVNIYDFYEAIEQINPSNSAELNVIKINTGAHEIGHMLGLSDLDEWSCACQCIYHTDNDESNDSECEYKGHHEEALMGYRQTESRVTHITYKDIAGVSITRGFHTDNDHWWMVREKRNEETDEIEQIDVVCALCNGVRTNLQAQGVIPSKIDYIDGIYYYEGQEAPLIGSCNQEHSLIGDNMILVASDGQRFFYKCSYCRYIEEKEIALSNTIPQYNSLDYGDNVGGLDCEYYRVNILFDGTYNLKVNEDNGLDIHLYDWELNEISVEDFVNTSNGCDIHLEEGNYYLYIVNNYDTDVEFNFTISPPPHTHQYTNWIKHSSTRHIECCALCGELGTVTDFHVIKAGSAIGNKAYCMYCGALINTGTDIGQVPGILSISKVTINGSYVLPNGIIVLVDADVEAYENGTLLWFDQDDLPQTQ